MSLALSNTVPSPTELQSYKIIAEVAATNQHWRKLGGSGSQESVVATILSVMLLAREIGISPMQAISGGINNVQGKFEISARLMNQLIRKHGHRMAIRMSSDEICVIWTKRKDTGEEHEEKYTIHEAIRSGLVKEGSAWKKVPSDMLFARCISRLARRLYPDCIGGCYVEGELQESIEGRSVKAEDLKDTVEIKNQMEVDTTPVVLNLPDYISLQDKELIIKYVNESCGGKNTIASIRRRANANMDGFLKAFKSWKAKQTVTELEEEDLSA